MLSQNEIEDIRLRCEEIKQLPANYIDAARVRQRFGYCACNDIPQLLDSVEYLRDLVRRMAEHLDPDAEALRQEAQEVTAQG